MRRSVAPFTLLLAAAALAAGCNDLECGAGTVQKTDPVSGKPVCVVPQATGVPCDTSDGGTAHLVGALCEGDPNKFPTCGPGTMIDPATNTCIPTGGGTITPPVCPKPDMQHICVNGIIRLLRDGSNYKGPTLQLGAYDPLPFLQDPKIDPIAMTTSTANGTYVMADIPIGMLSGGLVAIAVADNLKAPTTYPKSGSGGQNLQGGQSYQIDVWAVESSTVAGWDAQAAFKDGKTFESEGAYVAIFNDGAGAMAKPVEGVQITFNNAPAPDQYFFKGDRATIDKMLTATDAVTGSAVQRVSQGLGNYSGTGGKTQAGGAITWVSILGASVPNVVFVQVYVPMM